MTKHVEPERKWTTCDRCGETFDPVSTYQSGRREITTTVQKITKSAVTRPLWNAKPPHDKPRIIRADVDFCDSCWWEFDRLFCQGQAVPLRTKEQTLIPANPHRRETGQENTDG